jgi:hypothetical protein
MKNKNRSEAPASLALDPLQLKNQGKTAEVGEHQSHSGFSPFFTFHSSFCLS